MTYWELLEILFACHEEQLDQDVTICDMEGDFWPCVIQTMEEDDVLEAGHLYLDATD
jgi:hypothetical protein